MDIIDRTIQREGGFVDHPSDPGGATNMGVTPASWTPPANEVVHREPNRLGNP